MHVWLSPGGTPILDKKIANGMAVPEVRSRRASREQRDQPIVKYVLWSWPYKCMFSYKIKL